MFLRVSYIYGFVGLFGAGWAISACSSDATPGPAGTAGSGASQAGTAGVGVGGSASQAGSGAGTAAGTGTGGGAAGSSPLTTAGSGGSGTAGTGTGGVATGGAGAGGTAGGSGGSSGTGGGGTGGSGGAVSKMSAGCGVDSVEDPTKWTTHDVTVPVAAAYTAKFGMRRYFTRPPKNYNKNTPAVLTIWGQGCQQSVAEDTPMTTGPAAQGSIQLQLLADPDNHQCYSAGPDGDAADSPELPYFDKAVADVLAAYCIDTSKIFMGGYSSGGWVSSLIACNRANVVRGVGWAAAGLQKNHDACTGPVAALITRGVDDAGTPLDQTEAARDDLIKRNGCMNTTMPWLPGEAAFTTTSCVEYQGCKPGYPVVWCPTPGAHTNTVDGANPTLLTRQGLWKFWTTLPTP